MRENLCFKHAEIHWGKWTMLYFSGFCLNALKLSEGKSELICHNVLSTIESLLNIKHYFTYARCAYEKDFPWIFFSFSRKCIFWIFLWLLFEFIVGWDGGNKLVIYRVWLFGWSWKSIIIWMVKFGFPY